MMPRIKRAGASAPLKHLLKKGYIKAGDVVLDFGCGHGMDVKHLKDIGVDATGYDPYVKGYELYIDKEYDVVTATFVFNVIKTKGEHNKVRLELEKKNPNSTIFITVRNDLRKQDIDNWTHLPSEDVYITKSTCQRFYRMWTTEEAFPGYKTIKRTSGFIVLVKEKVKF